MIPPFLSKHLWFSCSAVMITANCLTPGGTLHNTPYLSFLKSGLSLLRVVPDAPGFSVAFDLIHGPDGVYLLFQPL